MDPSKDNTVAPSLSPEAEADSSAQREDAAGREDEAVHSDEAVRSHEAMPSDEAVQYDVLARAHEHGLLGSDFDHPGLAQHGSSVGEYDDLAGPTEGIPTDDGEDAAVDSLAEIPVSERPSYRFFGIVAALSLIADITTKVWAEVVINDRGFEPIKIVGENISITLAYNQGGAWGLFAGADEMVRKPFFLGVSAFAVFFIISLYSRLHPSQKALKWGLPLVLGGALGNLSDRITRSQVIDFIDYRGDWVLSLNSFVHKYFKGWAVTDHWPTFNVADIAICIGVGLMAVDMFTHRPRRALPSEEKNPPGGPSSLVLADESPSSSEPLAFSAPEALDASPLPQETADSSSSHEGPSAPEFESEKREPALS